MLNRLQITMDTHHHPSMGTTLYIEVLRDTDPPISIKRIIPYSDFESYFDLVWRGCKQLIDEELKK
jgi:hypothetical protein